MTAAATARPWHVGEPTGNRVFPCILAENGTFVVANVKCCGNRPQARRDAALIVRAVNNLDQLLTAANAVADAYRNGEDLPAAMESLLRAIAGAEGR